MRETLHFLGYAIDLFLHRLLAVRACSDFDACGDSRRAHRMNTFVAAFDRSENFVPVAFDVRAVRVKLVIQASFLQHLLAFRNVLAHRHANAHRNDTQIHNDFHLNSVSRNRARSSDSPSIIVAYAREGSGKPELQLLS